MPKGRAGGEGTGGNKREPSVRQIRGTGRRECAPRRTREEDHPGARSKLAEEGSLQPEKKALRREFTSACRTERAK
jgi:hypothetical protein